MLRNNIPKEIDMLRVSDGISQRQLADKMQVSQSYITRIKKKSRFVSTALLCLMEAMGYDIQLHYIKIEKNEGKKK